MSACPLTYSFCDETVTIYHKVQGKYQRKVVSRACMQWKDQMYTDAIGQVVKHQFLLILPGEETLVFPGDWVVPGVGPEIPEGLTFQPGLMEGLGQVRQTQKMYWENRVCHTEAKGE